MRLYIEEKEPNERNYCTPRTREKEVNIHVD